MRRFRKWLFAALLTIGATPVAVAQPAGETPVPVPLLWGSPVDGAWLFQGDLHKPCSVRTVTGPCGPVLLITNENGSEAFGQLSENGRQVKIPDWNLTGTVRGDSLVWSNGDYWQR
jgi:hypothetical protein